MNYLSNKSPVYSIRLSVFLMAFLLLTIALPAQQAKLGDISDGNRARPVHNIRLIDPDSSVIYPDEQPLMPFSTKRTCSPCHAYKIIEKGWHFNAGDSSAHDGRPGQPWIFADPSTATQLPLSLRDWPGTFRPQETGLTLFDYFYLFGRHMPGGGAGEDTTRRSVVNYWRWQISGDVEINCLACHDAEPAHDQAEYSAQMLRQNFRWATTAAMDFARVHGSARDLPDNYDIYLGVVPDDTRKIPPQVSYDAERFDRDNKVLLNITRHIKNDRCYYCHSVKTIALEQPSDLNKDPDVHLAAGLNCVDCHHNGLGHNMIRGYEKEAADTRMPIVASLTCKGCHLGTGQPGTDHMKGRLGAPYPEHKGIPMVHFDKLSCTVCHSGPWPAEQTRFVKTSKAHALGMHNVNKADSLLPHIQAPVFANAGDGKLTPNYLLWPAYWSEFYKGGYKPLPLKEVTRIAAPILSSLDTLASGNWPPLTDSLIAATLDTLAHAGLSDQEIVYVNGGFRFSLENDGTILKTRDDHLQPYLWPLAHDVRPAAQSLGINGCSDCHTTGSNLFFGKLSRDLPISVDGKQQMPMTSFMNEGSLAAWLFSFSFYFRPFLKIFIIISALIILAVLLVSISRGLTRVLQIAADDLDKRRN